MKNIILSNLGIARIYDRATGKFICRHKVYSFNGELYIKRTTNEFIFVLIDLEKYSIEYLTKRKATVWRS